MSDEDIVIALKVVIIVVILLQSVIFYYVAQNMLIAAREEIPVKAFINNTQCEIRLEKMKVVEMVGYKYEVWKKRGRMIVTGWSAGTREEAVQEAVEDATKRLAQLSEAKE